MKKQITLILAAYLVTLGSVHAQEVSQEEAGNQEVVIQEKVIQEKVIQETVVQETVVQPAETQNTVPEQPVALSVAELKKKVIKLNRDLFILEEDLLFPANTQFVVYLSLDTGEFFKPDSVTLKLDDDIVAAHLYTERQVQALQRGGMQRLHIGNLKSGEHELTVLVDGQGPDDRDYKRAATLVFEKGSDIASLEVQIRDRKENYQPEVDIVEWN